ncbi:hypothetical protein TNCV_1739831 [Trichonephila clavipes]|nr:hypothetical protein TNCV_1739831 [Trichonephila clavipes]
MAPQVKGNPPISTQTQASRATTTPQQVNTNQNSNSALITQTLQGIIQALSTLTTQISNMNFNDNIPLKIGLGVAVIVGNGRGKWSRNQLDAIRRTLVLATGSTRVAIG